MDWPILSNHWPVLSNHWTVLSHENRIEIDEASHIVTTLLGGRIAFHGVISLVFLMRKSRLRFIASTWSSVTARVRTSDLQPKQTPVPPAFAVASSIVRKTSIF